LERWRQQLAPGVNHRTERRGKNSCFLGEGKTYKDGSRKSHAAAAYEVEKERVKTRECRKRGGLKIVKGLSAKNQYRKVPRL